MLTELYNQIAQPLKDADIFKKIEWLTDQPEQHHVINTPAAFLELEEIETSPLGRKNHRFTLYLKVHIFVDFHRANSGLSTPDNPLHDVQQKAADALYAFDLVGIAPPRPEKNLLHAWLRYKLYGVAPLINRAQEKFKKPNHIRLDASQHP